MANQLFKTNSVAALNQQISLKQVFKKFENRAGQFNILQEIDLEIRQNEFVVITGKSGSGKSTLLNMITGIDRPTAGEVSVNGVDVHLLREKNLAPWRGRAIGIVFQFFQLMPTLTVLENVLLPMDFCKVISANKRKARAMDLLAQTDITAQANKLPGLLSGGEQQRVAIARALANDPGVIVADEPTGNLDSITSAKIIKLFENQISAGKTVIVVTHEKNLPIKASRRVTIADGKIIDNQEFNTQLADKRTGETL
jgi:putative ABC transport system ATP-binding protein